MQFCFKSRRIVISEQSALSEQVLNLHEYWHLSWHHIRQNQSCSLTFQWFRAILVEYAKITNIQKVNVQFLKLSKSESAIWFFLANATRSPSKTWRALTKASLVLIGGRGGGHESTCPPFYWLHIVGGGGHAPPIFVRIHNW